jgi:2,4-dienoyl-CoA reductase-like NADH-dependent reductase (Old Yellow Enzyme family)
MIPITSRIRKETGIPTAAGWLITDPKQADQAIRDEHTDLVVLARELLRDPYWPYHAAESLGIDKSAEVLPVQYARAVKPRKS